MARRITCLIMLAVLALGAGCRGRSDDAAAAQLAEALAAGSATFHLRYGVGARLAEGTEHASELTLANCETDSIQTFHYGDFESPAEDIVLMTEGMPAELAPFRGVMAAMVREIYRLEGSYPPAVVDDVEVHVAAGVQQQVRLDRAETWEENVIIVRIGDTVIANVPVRVLTRVAWSAQVRETTSCDEDASLAEETTTLILATNRPIQTATPATVVPVEPTLPSTGCETPVPTTPAQELVARYVALLDAGDHSAAYALLAETYRLRLPYPQYEAGYEPLERIELCSLETTWAGAQETVFATLRLRWSAPVDAPEELWVARYLWHEAGAQAAGGAIASVSMYRAALHE